MAAKRTTRISERIFVVLILCERKTVARYSRGLRVGGIRDMS